jgi:N-acetylgalactosamine-6-sulfatase
VEAAMNFIERDPGKPFFINLWLRAPHTPLRATEEQRKPYANKDEPWQTRWGVFNPGCP